MLITRSLTAALTALLVLPAVALADQGERTPLHLDLSQPKATGAAAATGGGSGGAIVRTILGLVVVVAVIYGLTWVLRQVKSSKEGKASGAGLQPIASLPLGPNRALHLVRAGAEVVLVGVGENSVVPVRTYTEAEARELGLLGDEEDGDGPVPPTGSSTGASGLPGGGGTPRRNWLAELRARTVIK
jgi:flagellar protein FliO/FliZ